jgi:hypothetical protein
MRCTTRAVAALVIASLLGGCSWLRSQADATAERALGAEPLAGQYPVCPASSGGTGTQTGTNVATPCLSTETAYTNVQTNAEAQQWIGAAASDSVGKCSAFIARMAYGDNFSNTALDITAIGLAGAGAITVPLHSAQTLAALAGITTATKAAINNDIFMQNAAPVIAQKINATYMPELKTFLGQTGSATQANLASLYGQLLAYHADCTLTGALAALDTGTNASTSKAPLTTSVLLAGATIADPTNQLQYQVTTAYSAGAGTFSYVQAAIGAAFPANLTTAQSVAATGFLATANSYGAFLLKPGS